MAFDGICVAALAHEFNDRLKDARINKISQPEPEELLLALKTSEGQVKLLMSASATLPLIYLTDINKTSPATAPAFCMLLRKHLTGARIISVTQPDFERVLIIELEHRDEMGDLCTKRLIIEIMGKHSNIIFTDSEGMILDSIKHISAAVSSVREVLPGRTWFIPQTQDKVKSDPTVEDEAGFTSKISACAAPADKAIYTSYTGISPLFAQELCHASGVNPDIPAAELSSDEIRKLYAEFNDAMTKVRAGDFSPEIIYEHGAPVDFCALHLTLYEAGPGAASSSETASSETASSGIASSETASSANAPFNGCRKYDSISRLLQDYYAEKNAYVNIRQRSAELRHIVTTALERNVKKYDLQIKQIRDTEKKDKYRIWGELLNTYGYDVKPGDKSVTVLNYYTEKEETIPLDPTLTASENSQKYFDRYNKLKRTYEALSTLTVEVSMEIEHLESVLNSLDIAQSEDDLNQIREELMESGLIRRKSTQKKVKITSKPFHYVTPDGFHIYVGKNNLQNDELTFKVANGGDWWFHSKKIPGSHVILKTEGREVPDHVFELAAAAAAYYCKGADQDKVEIDYVLRREVKKPAGSKPGFVVYYTNYSMAIAPDISELKLADQ